MRGFAVYILAGIFTVLALDIVAPPAGMGLAIGAWPTAEMGTIGTQSVDRSNKGDRLDVIEAGGISRKGKTQIGSTPAPRQPVPVGCEPAFSPLSGSAAANFARGCVG